MAGATPEITEDDIRKRVGRKSFDRGLGYFRKGAILAPKRRSNAIEARCRGSGGNVYRVSATFGPKGGLTADCSCPVGSGGYCKHLAAMLLTWRDRPGAFVESETVADSLARRSKDELLKLIRQMVRHDSDLESLIEATAPMTKSGRALGPPSSEVYRARAVAAFRKAGGDDDYGDYGTVGDVAEELEALREIGDALLKRGDHAGASAVYRGILDGVAEEYATVRDDDDGEVHPVVEACVDGLGACLAAIPDDPKARQPILDTLINLFGLDAEMGGIELGGDPIGFIEEHATPIEKAKLAARALDRAREFTGRYETYQREQFGRLYLDLAKPEARDAALAAFRELGMTRALIAHLLDEGKVAQAIEAVDKGGFPDSEMPEILAIFDIRHHRDVAETMIARRALEGRDPWLLRWLRDHHAKRGNTREAAKIADQLFKIAPNLQEFRSVRTLSVSDPDRWEKLRESMLKTLAQSAEWGAIVRAHLDEGDVTRAVGALKPARSGAWSPEPSLLVDVARAAESALPWEAIRIYKEVALGLVARKNRTAYIEACGHLKRVKELYTRYGEKTGWSRDMLAIRKAYRTLRAFHEELDRAGLT